MAHQEQESTVIDTIVIVVIIVTNAGQMSVSRGNRASDIRDPSLMHKIAMTELEMAATGQPPTDMISHTGVSQTTGGQITQTGAPDVPSCNSCVFSECQTNECSLIRQKSCKLPTSTLYTSCLFSWGAQSKPDFLLTTHWNCLQGDLPELDPCAHSAYLAAYHTEQVHEADQGDLPYASFQCSLQPSEHN